MKKKTGLNRGERSDREVNALHRIIKLTTPAPFRAISNSLKKFSSSFPSMYPFPERQTDYAITTYYQGPRFSLADMQKPHRCSCARGVKKIPAQLNVTIDSNMSLLPVTHPSTLGQYIGLLMNMMQTDHCSKAACSWSVAQRDTLYIGCFFSGILKWDCDPESIPQRSILPSAGDSGEQDKSLLITVNSKGKLDLS